MSHDYSHVIKKWIVDHVRDWIFIQLRSSKYILNPTKTHYLTTSRDLRGWPLPKYDQFIRNRFLNYIIIYKIHQIIRSNETQTYFVCDSNWILEANIITFHWKALLGLSRKFGRNCRHSLIRSSCISSCPYQNLVGRRDSSLLNLKDNLFYWFADETRTRIWSSKWTSRLAKT